MCFLESQNYKTAKIASKSDYYISINNPNIYVPVVNKTYFSWSHKNVTCEQPVATTCFTLVGKSRLSLQCCIITV